MEYWNWTKWGRSHDSKILDGVNSNQKRIRMKWESVVFCAGLYFRHCDYEFKRERWVICRKEQSGQCVLRERFPEEFWTVSLGGLEIKLSLLWSFLSLIDRPGDLGKPDCSSDMNELIGEIRNENWEPHNHFDLQPVQPQMGNAPPVWSTLKSNVLQNDSHFLLERKYRERDGERKERERTRHSVISSFLPSISSQIRFLWEFQTTLGRFTLSKINSGYRLLSAALSLSHLCNLQNVVHWNIQSQSSNVKLQLSVSLAVDCTFSFEFW